MVLRVSFLSFVILVLFEGSGCSGSEEENPGSAPASFEQPKASELSPGEEDELRVLGYLPWHEMRDEDRVKGGVLKHDSRLSHPGLNLWHSLPRNRAFLMNNDGEVLHSWHRDTGGSWGHIALLEKGRLLILQERAFKLILLDWNSDLVWERRMKAHHDADVSPSGEIYVLDSKAEFIDYKGNRIPIANDYLSILNEHGETLREVSFFEVLRDELDLDRALKRSKTIDASKGHLDLLHVNSIAIIDADYNEVFRKGRVLFCARSLNLIGVLDLEENKVVWKWGRKFLDWPHQPVLLESGNVMVFDNGYHRGFSRLIEINPVTEKPTWKYRGDPAESFFSNIMGGIQILPNHNVLITESIRGRAFEITRSGEIVWEFINPDVEKKKQERAAIYRVERIDPRTILSEERLQAMIAAPKKTIVSIYGGIPKIADEPASNGGSL